MSFVLPWGGVSEKVFESVNLGYELLQIDVCA